MNEKKWNWLFLIIDIVFFTAVLYWLMAPLFIAGTGFKIELIKITANFDSFKNSVGVPYFWLFLLSFLLYLTPAVLLFKIASLFLKGKYPGVFSPNLYLSFIINFIFSGLTLLFIILIILKRSTEISDLFSLDLFTVIIIISSIVYSIIQLINIINNIRYLIPSKQSHAAQSKSGDAMQQINPKQKPGRPGILEKLLSVFIITNKEIKWNRIFIIIDIVFFTAVLYWLMAPLFIVSTGFKIELIKITANFDSFKNSVGVPYFWLFLLSFLLYLTPAVLLFKIVSVFLKEKYPGVFSPNLYLSFIINFIFSGLTLLFLILIILKRSTEISDLFSLDLFTVIIIISSIVYSIIQLINIINNYRYLSSSYKSYVALSKSSGAMQQIKLQQKLGRLGILQKLLLVFIITNLVIILSLSSLLLSQFKKTIVDSVIATGTVLAEQSAGFILGNLKDSARERKMLNIEVDTYFKRQAAKNKGATLAFDSISWYRNVKSYDRSFVYMSTDNKLAGKELKRDYYTIDEVTNQYNSQTKNYDIIAPILMGQKKLGYSIVQYKQDEIFKTYRQTQFRILIFAIMIIYLAVILVYIIGTNIVFPILFLQMNTRKISSTLSNMIKGSEEIKASNLQYEDMIHTRDEIKTLSIEINKMVTVIKGIIPYISASTLQYSEKKGKTSTIKDLAFVFTDIRGFTTLSEGKSPNEVVSILNYYLDLQTQIILENKGDIDKFVGDEVMAVFDGPDKELNACKASLEIQKAMQAEKEKNIANNAPFIDIGIGINSGQAIFGSMGARERMDFTCIGDTVNIAARLEGANKEYKTKSLITESVYNQAHNIYLCREIDLMTVKGKKEPIKIYEILGEKSKINKKAIAIKENFEKGLKLYREKKWDEARAIFNENVEKFKDGPSGVFYIRCVIFKKNPPPTDWDWVFNMTVK